MKKIGVDFKVEKNTKRRDHCPFVGVEKYREEKM